MSEQEFDNSKVTFFRRTDLAVEDETSYRIVIEMESTLKNMKKMKSPSRM